MTAENTGEVKRQGYKNPITGGRMVAFNEEAFHENFWQRLRIKIRYPVRMTPSETEEFLEKVFKEEAEELWGPNSREE